MPLWHERDISHSSAERVVLPDSTILLDYLLDRFAWVIEGLVVVPRAHAAATSTPSHGLTFSGRVLLALVEAGLSREAAYAIVQRNAMRAWDEELPLRELLAADPEAAALLEPRRSTRLRPGRALRATPSVPFDRLEALMSSSLALDHLASGKVRELYDAGDDRLLLVASDRISAFDVVLPTPIPDKGRVLTGLSPVLVRLHGRHRAATT